MAASSFTARKADRHVLYRKSVQNPDYDAAYVDRLFRKLRGRRPKTVKEDFCGTFSFCCEWVKLSDNHEAIGVDLDKSALKWGKREYLSELDESQQKRVTLKQTNVLSCKSPRVDAICAFNFSYYVFKTRKLLRSYFENAYRTLVKDGILFLDAFGGSDSFLEQEERRRCDGFVYVWEHARYHPVTADLQTKIHFEFPDGTQMRNAFTYDWRMWTMVELRELLHEAKFKDVMVYWEGTDSKSGEGNGIFRPTTRGEACQSWIAYIIAQK